MSNSASILHQALVALDGEGILAAAPAAVLKLQQAGDGEPLDDAERAAAGQFLALLHVAFAVAAADHKLEPVEQQHLYEMLEELSDRQIPHVVMEDFFDLWSEGLIRQGFDTTIRGLAAEIPSPQFRRLAYVAAAGVAHADQILQDEELRVLSLIADAFEIPPPEAVRLREQVAQTMG